MAHAVEEEPVLHMGVPVNHGKLAMWIFLATEIMFFTGLIGVYIILRNGTPTDKEPWPRPEDVHLREWIGAVNTFVLICSSLTVVLAHYALGKGNLGRAVQYVAVTLLLGTVFLVIKGFEYRAEYLQHLVPGADFRFDAAQRDVAELFFWLYFVMTGIHAIHLAIGIVVIGVVAARLAFGGFALQSPLSVEMAGLYWHFVDVVWIFIYPCLYLIARS